MHSKDTEAQTFFGYTGHFDLMDSMYQVLNKEKSGLQENQATLSHTSLTGKVLGK